MSRVAAPRIEGGKPFPMGPSLTETGVNFAVFSDHATATFICLFDSKSGEETARLALPEREGGIWYGHVTGIGPGQHYGLRAAGPWAPREGHLFNVNKLLLDPYARLFTDVPEISDACFGYAVGADENELSPIDSAPFMPRCIITDPLDPAPRGPRHDWRETVIYEAHVKGLTKQMEGVEQRGTLAGLAEPLVIGHLKRLGVTALELLPVHAFVTDAFLQARGLTNYWGYQTVGFFAPHPAYLGHDGLPGLRQTVHTLHKAGIEVILDVVYNHSGEGDETGPHLCFRGLDNASYYRLTEDGRPINHTGTGNTLNLDHPMVMRMVLDSLRYWVEAFGVDGFRFDLAATLGRTEEGFDPGAAFFDALRQDPVLAGVKLIAEPWDIGPGGYRRGAFPPPFREWNDRYRDDVRRFWRGDDGMVSGLASALTGSADAFDHDNRKATSSINLLTAHDGFTLHDVVSFSQRHNEANGEEGRDGHGENFSDNLGVEGASDDPAIMAARDRRKRAMLATLFLSQGVPMLLGGDEFGNSQSGNNNAYAQDNETGWLNWHDADEGLIGFVTDLSALRQRHPLLRQSGFLHGERLKDGQQNLSWHRADGAVMSEEDWHDPQNHYLGMMLNGFAEDGLPVALYIAFNAGGDARLALPDCRLMPGWRALFSSRPSNEDSNETIAAQTVRLFAAP